VLSSVIIIFHTCLVHVTERLQAELPLSGATISGSTTIRADAIRNHMTICSRSRFNGQRSVHTGIAVHSKLRGCSIGLLQSLIWNAWTCCRLHATVVVAINRIRLSRYLDQRRQFFAEASINLVGVTVFSTLHNSSPVYRIRIFLDKLKNTNIIDRHWRPCTHT
jgi:hypothetical protein